MTNSAPLNSASLNIVHVILSRGFAGSERSTAESCNAQCEEHNVAVVIRNDHRKKGKSIVDHLDDRVTVYEVPSRFFTKYFLGKALKNIKPDVIHCHLRRSTRLVARLSTPAGKISTLHISVNGPHFMDMDGIICNARWQLDDMPEGYEGLVMKANNSLVPHRRLEDSEIEKLRADLGIQNGDILIGAVGRYNKSKAWDVLIKAFSSLSGHKNAKLLFFGAGSLEQELKSLAGNDERIRFVGFKDNIKDYYQVFDLLVCPSRFEPLPRVMLEAYDGGVPIIASDIGGCLELVEDYGGVAFKVDDVADLAAKLDHELKGNLARHRPDLSAHYVENANSRMVSFYREVVEHAST